MRLRQLLLALFAAAFLAGGCGGPPLGSLPADSPLKPWEAPDPDELVDDGDDDDDGDDEDDDDDDDDEAPAAAEGGTPAGGAEKAVDPAKGTSSN